MNPITKPETTATTAEIPQSKIQSLSVSINYLLNNLAINKPTIKPTAQTKTISKFIIVSACSQVIFTPT